MIDSRCKRYEPFFGKWKIDKELGKGAFGQVYRIYWEDDLGGRTTSALKFIHIPSEEALANQKEIQPNMEAVRNYFLKQVERIKDEILILQKCKGQSNIVSYEDHLIVETAGEDEIGWDILIRMELLYPLNPHFSRKEATQYDVVRMWLDITNALIYCEDQNIIHRDIKPANILISESGSYKLSDFGVARKNMQGAAEASTRVGTQKYMAPEVDRNLKYDKRADYYSLGCVIYFFLNKRRLPFYPPYPQEVDADDALMAEERRVKGNKIPALKDASKEVNRVLLKSLEYKPDNRYRSARELYDAVQKLLRTQEEDLKKRYLNSEMPMGAVVQTTRIVDERSAYGKKKKSSKSMMVPVVIAGLFLIGGIGGIIYGVSMKNFRSQSAITGTTMDPGGNLSNGSGNGTSSGDGSVMAPTPTEEPEEKQPISGHGLYVQEKQENNGTEPVADGTDSPEQEPIAVPEPTDTPIPEPTATPTPEPTATPTPEPTATPTPEPTATPTPEPTATPTPEPTATPTPEPTATPTPEPTATPTPEPTATPTPEPTATPTPEPTATPTPEPTATPTPSPTPVPTLRALGKLERPQDGDSIAENLKLKGWILTNDTVGNIEAYIDIVSGDTVVASYPVTPEETGEKTLEKRQKKNAETIAAARSYDLKDSQSLADIPDGTYTLNLCMVEPDSGAEEVLESMTVNISGTQAASSGDVMDLMGIDNNSDQGNSTHVYNEEKGFAVGIDAEDENAPSVTANPNQVVLTGWINADPKTSLGMFVKIDSTTYTTATLADAGGSLELTRVPRFMDNMDSEIIGGAVRDTAQSGYIAVLKLPFLGDGAHTIAISFNIAPPDSKDTEIVDIVPITLNLDSSVEVNENAVTDITDAWAKEFPQPTATPEPTAAPDANAKQ